VKLGRFGPHAPEGSDRLLLVSVTEKHSRSDLDRLVAVMKEAAHA
jgi:hypothetical protein